MGDGDPKCKCKKISGTKIGEQNKNSRTKIGGWNKKKSAEQKLVSRTKTAEQKLFIILSHPNKNWWGQCKCKKVSRTKIGRHCQPIGWTGTPSASAKRSAEPKLQNKNCGTKIGGDSWRLGDGDPKCKYKKVSGTKIGEDSQSLVDRDPKCKCKKVSGTKIAEQKLWNKNWWGLLAIG